jgi:hypothetical protein
VVAGRHLPAGAAAVLLVTTGAAWGIDSIYVLWKRRRWAWWMLTWPVVTALGVALALVAQPESHDVRPDFESVAHQLLAEVEPTSLHDDFEIGRFEVDMVYSTPRGDVFFSDNRRSMFNTESGWAYSPDGAPAPPTRDGEFTAEHHEGPWYRYSRVIDF